MNAPLKHPITGAGGGGGGKGGSGNRGKESRNTLLSNGRIQLVMAISEGEIDGLVDSDRSIYFDETALRSSDGRLNFEGVTWEVRNGLPDQPHFSALKAAEEPHEVEVQVKEQTGPVIRTLNNDNADAIRLVTRIPSAAKYEDDGDIRGVDIEYAFDIRPYNGSWSEVVRERIRNQKCTAPFQRAHYVKLPEGGSPWDIRMRRITGDSDSSKLQNDTYWEA
ncbi:MAG: hypothetical protein JJ979_03355, partial [Roseibium sp.]|nr:hypothetical protein [Roseibium sp.]